MRTNPGQRQFPQMQLQSSMPPFPNQMSRGKQVYINLKPPGFPLHPPNYSRHPAIPVGKPSLHHQQQAHSDYQAPLLRKGSEGHGNSLYNAELIPSPFTQNFKFSELKNELSYLKMQVSKLMPSENSASTNNENLYNGIPPPLNSAREAVVTTISNNQPQPSTAASQSNSSSSNGISMGHPYLQQSFTPNSERRRDDRFKASTNNFNDQPRSDSLKIHYTQQHSNIDKVPAFELPSTDTFRKGSNNPNNSSAEFAKNMLNNEGETVTQLKRKHEQQLANLRTCLRNSNEETERLRKELQTAMQKKNQNEDKFQNPVSSRRGSGNAENEVLLAQAARKLEQLKKFYQTEINSLEKAMNLSNQSMKRQRQDLEKTMATLKNRISELELHKQMTEQNHSECMGRKDREIDALKQETAILLKMTSAKMLGSNNTQNQEASSQKMRFNLAVKEKEQELQKVQSELTTKNVALRSEQNLVIFLKAQILQKQDEVVKVNNQLALLKKGKTSLEQELAKSNEDNTKLQQILVQNSQTNRQAESNTKDELKRLSQTNLQLIRQIKDLKTQIATLTDQLHQATAKLQSKDTEVKLLTEKLAETEANLTSSEQKVFQFNSDLTVLRDELQDSYDKHQFELQSKDNAYKQLQEDNRKLEEFKKKEEKRRKDQGLQYYGGVGSFQNLVRQKNEAQHKFNKVQAICNQAQQKLRVAEILLLDANQKVVGLELFKLNVKLQNLDELWQ